MRRTLEPSAEEQMNDSKLRVVLAWTAAMAAAGLVAQACAAGGDDGGTAGAATSTGVGGQGGAGTVSSSSSTSVTVGVGGMGGGNGNCAEASSAASSAELPADIIVAVDNSGSMTQEAADVQAAMNTFVTSLTSTGIDAHVVLISDDSGSSEGVCVPAPLGSGSCPADQKLPAYRHVVSAVGSTNALQKIVDTYDQWKDSLRANAVKHVIVISDDDSSKTAASFTTDLVAKDATLADFTFHAIVAPYELDTVEEIQCAAASTSNCGSADACCGVDSYLSVLCVALPASEGTVYKQLVTQTSGVLGNLCTQDFPPVFNTVATAVITEASVECVYAIPDPGAGVGIDPAKVNVNYLSDPNASPETLLNVPGGAMDCGVSGGWYYDDPVNPTQITLCDATCTAVKANNMAVIGVEFGCDIKLQ
jgi:hypothetical protein